MKDNTKTRIAEIKYQLANYEETKGKSLPKKEFELLKKQAKKYGVSLKKYSLK